MEIIQNVKISYGNYTAVDALLSKLDMAIDDMENDSVISEEEMWAELNAI